MTATFDTRLPAPGPLRLQRCGACARVNYPPRELCGNCLAQQLRWETVSDTGTVLSHTELHHALEPYYRDHLPWRVASIALDCGPVALAHLQPGIDSGARVVVNIAGDRQGNRMLVARAGDPEQAGRATGWLHSVNFFTEVTS